MLQKDIGMPYYQFARSRITDVALLSRHGFELGVRDLLCLVVALFN